MAWFDLDFLKVCARIRTVGMFAIAVALISLQPASVQAQDDGLSKFLLIKISREQSSVLCGHEKFTQCMAFTKEQCLALSEKAVEKCLQPLPERIDLAKLGNDAIESCPKQVYEDAGFAEEKAQQCLSEALQK